MNTLREPLAYERSGSGDPVVLLHGLGTNRAIWREAMPRLSRTRDVIAVDLLGFGESPRPSDPLRLAALSDALDDLLDRLELPTVDLVGNSLGGWLALFFALEHPEQVRKVVAVAPAFLFGLPEYLSADALAAGAGPKDMEAMRTYLQRVWRDANRLTEDEVRRHLEDRLAARDEHSIGTIAASIKTGEDLLTDRLPQIRTETLVVHGKHDRVVSLEQSERVAREIEGAGLRLFEDSAHWPQLEEPDSFVQTVEEFLA